MVFSIVKVASIWLMLQSLDSQGMVCRVQGLWSRLGVVQVSPGVLKSTVN